MSIALAIGATQPAVAASQGPTLTVTPATGLVDGQGISLAADGFCLNLASFPITGDYLHEISPTAVDVTAHAGFVSGDGSAVACVQSADQCVILALGVTPDGIALKSVPISFASAPKTRPGAPTGVAATATGRSVTVTRDTPVSDGGSPITGYAVTPYIGAVAQRTQRFKSADTTQVLRLRKHKTYTFRVAARNDVGAGHRSAPSNALPSNGHDFGRRAVGLSRDPGAAVRPAGENVGGAVSCESLRQAAYDQHPPAEMLVGGGFWRSLPDSHRYSEMGLGGGSGIRLVGRHGEISPGQGVAQRGHGPVW